MTEEYTISTGELDQLEQEMLDELENREEARDWGQPFNTNEVNDWNTWY